MNKLTSHRSDRLEFAPFGKGGDKTRQRLVGDLLFARRANPPSPALRTPAPFFKGGTPPKCDAHALVGVRY